MEKIKESDKEIYVKVKDRINEYIKIYKASNFDGKQNLKKEIYSLTIAESLKDRIWQQIVRSG